MHCEHVNESTITEHHWKFQLRNYERIVVSSANTVVLVAASDKMQAVQETSS